MSAQESLTSCFQTIRSHTEQLCALLEIEDHVVQPAPFVSPPKWHLAHTTWFFDNFILSANGNGNTRDESQLFNLLFNSYYKSQGEHWLQQHRGHLSRPTVATIMAYREAVSEGVMEFMLGDRANARARHLVTLGLHHEQQHQELLLMDIKYILGMSPDCPRYDTVSLPDPAPPPDTGDLWQYFDGGLLEIGASDDTDFVYDNESPSHAIWLEPFTLARRLVRNGEYLAFLNDAGYKRPELWLSDGWEWVRDQGIESPMYWRQSVPPMDATTATWHEYHLGGLKPLDPDLPVSHVSFYEADAYARWAGARLPAEAELEIASRRLHPLPRHSAFWQPGRSVCPLPDRAMDEFENGLLWQWTRSPYAAYPGYAAEAGALGEYNGKFMSNQLVLRGGCVATPTNHWRPTYRNFYRPGDRWCFSGIRLARDCA